MWKQMEGEGSRQAAPDGGSGGEEGSHTHCVVAVMGGIDFWLKDYYRTPKSGVQLHPPPPHQVSRPSEFCLLWALGRQLPLRLTKNTNKFMRALSSAHTRSSCGLGMSYTEVLSSNIEFWPRQGSHFPKPCAKNRGGGGGGSPNSLFQPYPNILLSPCWSSTLLGCTGMQASRYPPAAGSSDSRRMYLKENSQGKRDKAGQKEVRHQNQEKIRLMKEARAHMWADNRTNWVSPKRCIYLKAFDYWKPLESYC